MFDCRESRHVHVRGKDGAGAKLWLRPVSVAETGTYDRAQVRHIERITTANRRWLVAAWDGIRAESVDLGRGGRRCSDR